MHCKNIDSVLFPIDMTHCYFNLCRVSLKIVDWGRQSDVNMIFPRKSEIDSLQLGNRYQPDLLKILTVFFLESDIKVLTDHDTVYVTWSDEACDDLGMMIEIIVTDAFKEANEKEVIIESEDEYRTEGDEQLESSFQEQLVQT